MTATRGTRPRPGDGRRRASPGIRWRSSVHSPNAIAPADDPARTAPSARHDSAIASQAAELAEHGHGQTRGRRRRDRRTGRFARDGRWHRTSPGHAVGAAAPRGSGRAPANQRTAFATARSGSCLAAAVAMTNAGRPRSGRLAASTSSSSTGSLPGWSSAPPTSASGPYMACNDLMLRWSDLHVMHGFGARNVRSEPFEGRRQP